jgi:hypothetical protein
MKYVFSIVYIFYFTIQAYYIQADHLTGDPLEFWGKMWFFSQDLITVFLAIGLGFGWYDPTLRRMALVGALYHLFRMVFDICWLNGWACVESIWWTAFFFMLIFTMNLILLFNGRHFKG